MLRQIGGLEEGDGLGATNPAISIQIRPSKIRIEEIHIRRLVLRRRHQRETKLNRTADRDPDTKALNKSTAARADRRSKIETLEHRRAPIEPIGRCVIRGDRIGLKLDDISATEIFRGFFFIFLGEGETEK